MGSFFPQITTVLGGIVIPIFAVGITWALRGKAFVQTSWTDVLLAFAVFDFAMAMSGGPAQAFVSSDDLRPHSVAIFITLGVASLLSMICSIKYLERELSEWYLSRDLRRLGASGALKFTAKGAPKPTPFPSVRMISVTTVFVVVLGVHFVTMALK